MVTRIRQLLEHKQLTPTQFADLIGVGRPVVSHILSERNKPSLEVAQRIGSAFPDISLAWLMFGTGDMLAPAAAPVPATAPNKEPVVPAPVGEPLPVAATPPAEAEPLPPASAAPEVIASAVPLAAETAPSATPVRPLQALPRPFSVLQPVVTAPASPVPTSTPVPNPGESQAPEVVPAVPQPFRVARFVPAPAAPPKTATTRPAVPPAAGPLSAADPLAAVPASSAVAAATATALPARPDLEAAMLPFLSESGKAIRRIVIFYRDGSFADYQPE